MKYPKNKQLVRATFKDGHVELARFYKNSVLLDGEPGFETRYPSQILPVDEVVSWEPAYEKELD